MGGRKPPDTMQAITAAAQRFGSCIRPGISSEQSLVVGRDTESRAREVGHELLSFLGGRPTLESRFHRIPAAAVPLW